MPLPHVHGNASGEIAHNAIYDTGITPGSTLGKFIGFGEEGTTAVANRAHWALSENIDFVYQIMAADRALPAGASWLVPGGGANTFQFTGDVWVGDAGYPTIENEGLLLLFSVLDDQYNELTDGGSNEVRVAVVRDTTNVTNAYKAGFETNAVITFKTVDPTTGADVVNPYTIPAATNVRILYAEKGNLESLPIDSFIKFKVHSGAEVEAGVLLQDGTRVMTADLNLDDNDLININNLVGTPANNLTLQSALNLILQSVSGEVIFADSRLGGSVFLTEAGTTSLDGFSTSLIGALNSKTNVSNAFQSNRSVDQTGTIVFTGGTGEVAWPTLTVLIDGEYRTIAPGNLTATNFASVFVAVVTAAGTVLERAPQSVQSTDTPIAAYTWNGAAFTLALDIRRKLDGRTGQLEITCGSAFGTDFTSNQFQEALEFASRMSFPGLGIGSVIVRISGLAVAPTTPNTELDIRSPITVLGYGPDLSVISSDENNGHTTVLFDCNSHRVRFENLTLKHSGDTQAGTLGCFRNAGDGSIFRNLKFTSDGGTFDVGFGNAFSWTAAAKNILIEKIESGGTGLTSYFVVGSQLDFDTAFLTDSVVRDVYVSAWGPLAIGGIIANGDGNKLSNIEFPTGLDDFGMVVGNETLVDSCKFRMSGATNYTVTSNGTTDNISAPAGNIQTATVALGAFTAPMVGGYVLVFGAINGANVGMFLVTAQTGTTISYLNPTGVVEAASTAQFDIEPAGILYYPLSSPAYDNTTTIRDCLFLRINGAALRYTPINDTGIVASVVMRNCRTNQVHKPVDLQWVRAVDASSMCHVNGNHFRDTDDFVSHVENLWRFHFTDNVCTTTTGTGVIIGFNAGGLIQNNFFAGCGSAGAFPSILEVSIGAVSVQIVNNIFGVAGAPAASSQVVLWRLATVTGNQFIATGGAADITGVNLKWFVFGAGSSTITSNIFAGQTGAGVLVNGGANQCRIEGNQFLDIPELKIGIHVLNATNTLIQGNHFGGAFYVGQGILVASTGASDGESTQIIGNHFRDVQGDGPALWAIIEINGGGGGGKNAMINNNYFHNCGQNEASHIQHTIYALSLSAQVCHNHLHNHVNSYDGTGTCFGIYVPQEGILVSGNVLYHNIGAAIPAGQTYGIFTHMAGVAYRRQVITNNVINWFGTNAGGAGKTLYALYIGDNDDVVVASNYFREWDATGSTQLAIFAPAGTANYFIGNISRTRSVNVNVGSKPTGTAIKTDFNTGTGF